MQISPRTIGLSLAMLMPAAFLLGPTALAQTQPAATNQAPQSVTVSGQRSAAGDPTMITAAKSKVLSRTLASGCNYMSAYSASEDDVTQAYMSDMGVANSISDDAERFSEFSPDGNAADMRTQPVTNSDLPPADRAAAGGCSGSDYKFAAGRNSILRKDKSLAQAVVAFDAKDYAKAQTLAKIAYDKIGYDEAALMLANIQLYGLGTPKNTPAAVVWLKKVTEARFDPMRDTVKFDPAAPETMTARVEATLTLAKIYLRGMGTPKNAAEAVKWYGEAAKIGFVPANNTLGLAQLKGFGGPQDARKALAYFKEAAEAGYVPAQYNLAKMYYTGDHGVPQDIPHAGAWFAAAAKSGHAGAQYAVGRMYDVGKGVAVDQKKAIVYYKEAALKSDPDAQSALATYFYTGEVVEKNLATARKLFAAAAKQGQADAMFNLGVMNANGEGGAKDMATAYVWLALAKNSGQESAAAALKAIGGKLTADEMTKADSVLNPKPKATKAGG